MKPMLAKKYDDRNPTGWWLSEKLDGVRAIWTGEEFISRTGKTFHAPEWFTKALPDVVLDGELWMGRGMFQESVGIIRSHQGDWSNIRFMIFDRVSDGGFEKRMQAVGELSLPEHCEIVEQTLCQGKSHLKQFESDLLALGAEGVMIRAPRSEYQHKRSSNLLKLKQFKTDEAVVTGHEEGLGKHFGRLGALVCQYQGKSFKIGTGLSDDQREYPPEIGSLVTFSYFEKTNGGIPRHPSFVEIRNYE